MFTFHFALAQSAEELSVNANEVVVVLSDPGDRWLEVKRETQLCSGYVPASYVHLI